MGDTWRGGKSFIVGNIIKRLVESGSSILVFDVENVYELGSVRVRSPQELENISGLSDEGMPYL